MIRKSGEWMTKYDDRILEYIRENGTGRPADIARHEYIYCSASYIGQRLRELENNGLLEVTNGSVYNLSDSGRAYLIGAYDAESKQFLHEINPQKGARNYEWARLKMQEFVDDAKLFFNNYNADE